MGIARAADGRDSCRAAWQMVVPSSSVLVAVLLPLSPKKHRAPFFGRRACIPSVGFCSLLLLRKSAKSFSDELWNSEIWTFLVRYWSFKMFHASRFDFQLSTPISDRITGLTDLIHPLPSKTTRKNDNGSKLFADQCRQMTQVLCYITGISSILMFDHQGLCAPAPLREIKIGRFTL